MWPKCLYVAFGKQDRSVWWVLKEKKKRSKVLTQYPCLPPQKWPIFLTPLRNIPKIKGAVTVNPLGNDFQRITYLIVLVSLKKTTATTITQKIVGSYLTPLFRSRVRFKIICQESSDIVDSSLQRNNIQSGTDIIYTRWFHSSSGTSSQNSFRTPSSFATSLNTCQMIMSCCPLILLKVFLRWNSFVLQKVSPFSKHTDSTLPITASTPFVWTFSSYTQSLKGDFKFWRALSSWSGAFWRASRKAAF